MSISTDLARLIAAKASLKTAIESKGVSVSASALLDTYPALVTQIPQLDTSSATATAGDMLSGKTAYVKGVKVTGTIGSKAAATITPGTTDQTIAAGQYLSGAQTIAGDSDLLPANIKAGKSIFGVSGASAVVDTSSADAAASHILLGKKAYVNGALITGSISSKSAATITPGTTAQTIAAGQYLSGIQTISGDSNLVAASIKKGVSIFGVAGSFTADATAVATDMLSGKTAYVNGVKVTGTIPSKGAASYTPGVSNQTISSGQYLSGGQTILGDADLVAGNIRSGVNIFGVMGTVNEFKSAKGSTSFSGGNSVTITCGFTPQIVVGYARLSNGDRAVGYFVNGVGSFSGFGASSDATANLSSKSFTITSTGFSVVPNGSSGTFYWAAAGY